MALQQRTVYIRNHQKQFIQGISGTVEELKVYARREVGKLGLRCLFKWDPNFDDAGRLCYRCGDEEKHIWAYIISASTGEPAMDDELFSRWLHEHHSQPRSPRLA